MLIGLSGALTGYNGTYPWEKPGEKFNGTAYEGMRIVREFQLIIPLEQTEFLRSKKKTRNLSIFGLIKFSEYFHKILFFCFVEK